MELRHKNRVFEILELVEPFTKKRITSDIVSVFEVVEDEDGEDEYIFIDYICGALEEDRNSTLALIIDLLDKYIKNIKS